MKDFAAIGIAALSLFASLGACIYVGSAHRKLDALQSQPAPPQATAPAVSHSGNSTVTITQGAAQATQDKDEVTTAEIAAMRGVTQRWVSEQIRDGFYHDENGKRWPARQEGREWRILNPYGSE